MGGEEGEEAFSKNPGVIAQIAMDEVAPHGELDDRSTAEVKKDEQEEDLYNINNFTL